MDVGGNKVVRFIVNMSVKPGIWLACLFLLLPAGPLAACSCSPEAFASACHKVSTIGVVFLGSVAGTQPSSLSPRASGVRDYRFRVETIYKGLKAGTVEVVVNPENFSSCRREFKQGARYLIFASTWPGSEVVYSGACHGSKLAEYAKEDLQFLEAYRKNEAGTSVHGRVLQWLSGTSPPSREEDAPVVGAAVTLKSSTAEFAVNSTSLGDFTFDGIPPGPYTLTARRDPYVARALPLKITVPASGCVEAFPVLEAHASISGRLTTEEGVPGKRTRMELLRKNAAGQWYSTYQFWKQTDDTGGFTFSDLPDGDYLLGYELWGGRPSLRAAYPTHYYPGVADIASATIIHVAPHQHVTDLKLQLPRPHTPRPIRAEVVWRDGRPPPSNLLQLFDGRDLVQNLGGRWNSQGSGARRGIFEFTGYAERSYDLHVRYWIDDLSEPGDSGQKRIALSEHVKLTPGADPATVKLVLTRVLLADDEH